MMVNMRLERIGRRFQPGLHYFELTSADDSVLALVPSVPVVGVPVAVTLELDWETETAPL